MMFFGGAVVLATFALIIKKYEARMVLFAAGLIMCLVGGAVNDLINTFTQTMVHKTLVPTICSVMGFSFVMKYTQCDRHLVTAISSVITKVQFIIIPMAMLLTWWINIAIPSAAGCAAAVGSILIPTMMAAGVHPAMAASAVMAGTWGSAISPGTSHNPVVAKLANTDVMTVIMNEAPAAIITSFIVVAAITVVSVVLKEGPSEERRHAYAAAQEGGEVEEFHVNPIKALVPLIPLVMLILGSKQVAILPATNVQTAMVTGVLASLIVTMSNPQEVTKEFFKGMGEGYGSVIGLIIAAAVFTAGMKAVGLTGALIDLMKGSESIAKIAGAFGTYIIAIVSGSGDAAALAFNGAITPHAEKFGMTIMNLGSLAQMSGAIGRSMSPVAGAAIICAGMANVSPMDIAKRNAIPMLIGVISFMLLF